MDELGTQTISAWWISWFEKELGPKARWIDHLFNKNVQRLPYMEMI